jgi:hypothetical protein
MGTSRKARLAREERPEDELERGTQQRRRRDMELSMSERLARMQELCKQATAIGRSTKHR